MPHDASRMFSGVLRHLTGVQLDHHGSGGLVLDLLLGGLLLVVVGGVGVGVLGVLVGGCGCGAHGMFAFQG